MFFAMSQEEYVIVHAMKCKKYILPKTLIVICIFRIPEEMKFGLTRMEMYILKFRKILGESILLQKGQKMEPPVADVRGGNYAEAKTVSLTAFEEGADIYYTIDGSKPSRENGILYKGPISISEAVELKAIASKSGRPNSDVMSETYSFAISKETVNMDDLELGEDKAGKVEDDITQVFPADYELELALVPVKGLTCEVQVDGTYKVKVIYRHRAGGCFYDDETEWLRYKKVCERN